MPTPAEPTAAPALQPADEQRATTRLTELTWGTCLISFLSFGSSWDQLALTIGRERFTAFTTAEMRDAAETLARYRVASLAVLRQTDRESRTMFVRDLREGERRTFPKMQLAPQIVGHFSPQQLRNRPNAKDPSYEEVALPDRLATFAVDFSGLSGLLKPNQDMANVISLELARGRRKVPAYTHFIAPKIADAPWPVASADHSAAIGKWRSNTRIAKRVTHQALPIQAWLPYQLLFLLTAEMMGALSSFGGLPAGLAHLAIVLNLAATDSVAVAMVYDRLAKQHLDENARARDETTLGGEYSASFLATVNASWPQTATEFAPRPNPVKNAQVANKNSTADAPAQPPRQYVRRFRTQPAAASPPRRRSPAVRGRSRKRSRTPPRNPSKNGSLLR